MQKSFVARVLPLAAIAFVVAVVASLMYPWLVERTQTSGLRATFQEESARLQPALKELGVRTEAKEYFQCADTERTRLKTTAQCINFYIYGHNTTPMSESDRQVFPQKAAALDTLLRDNGWKPDRPNDPIATIAGSNPFLPENGGVGGSVPFYKNTPDGSCSFKLDVDSAEEGHNPGALNMVEFSCQKDISYFSFNWRTFRAVGP